MGLFEMHALIVHLPKQLAKVSVQAVFIELLSDKARCNGLQNTNFHSSAHSAFWNLAPLVPHVMQDSLLAAALSNIHPISY